MKHKMKCFELRILCMEVINHRRKRPAHRCPISLDIGLATKPEVRSFQGHHGAGLEFSFLKCQLMRFKASFISTLVNNETKLKLLCTVIAECTLQISRWNYWIVRFKAFTMV